MESWFKVEVWYLDVYIYTSDGMLLIINQGMYKKGGGGVHMNELFNIFL